MKTICLALFLLLGVEAKDKKLSDAQKAQFWRFRAEVLESQLTLVLSQPQIQLKLATEAYNKWLLDRKNEGCVVEIKPEGLICLPESEKK